MFDIGWSELLIIGVLALIVVGPKDLPVLLRTIGRYVGIIRRQASEFRAQFDEAIRDSELDQIRKDMAGIRQDVASTVHEASKQVEQDIEAGKMDTSARAALESKTKADAAKPETAGAAEAKAASPGKADTASPGKADNDDDGGGSDVFDIDEWRGAIEPKPEPVKPVSNSDKEPQRREAAGAGADKNGV